MIIIKKPVWDRQLVFYEVKQLVSQLELGQVHYSKSKNFREAFKASCIQISSKLHDYCECLKDSSQLLVC